MERHEYLCGLNIKTPLLAKDARNGAPVGSNRVVFSSPIEIRSPNSLFLRASRRGSNLPVTTRQRHSLPRPYPVVLVQAANTGPVLSHHVIAAALILQALDSDSGSHTCFSFFSHGAGISFRGFHESHHHSTGSAFTFCSRHGASGPRASLLGSRQHHALRCRRRHGRR